MIVLSWLATSTLTAPGGGDTLNTVYRQLVFDGAENEAYTAASEVTAHAVERASDIADHIRPGLRKISLDARFVTDPTVAREELEVLRRAGQIVTLTTGIGEYADMVIIRLGETRSVSTGDSYFVALEVQEIRRVDSEETAAPAPQVERARLQSNRGGQATQSSSDTAAAPSTDATQRQTAAAALAERAGLIAPRGGT